MCFPTLVLRFQMKGKSYWYIDAVSYRNVSKYNQQYRYKILTITLCKKTVQTSKRKGFMRKTAELVIPKKEQKQVTGVQCSTLLHP